MKVRKFNKRFDTPLEGDFVESDQREYYLKARELLNCEHDELVEIEEDDEGFEQLMLWLKNYATEESVISDNKYEVWDDRYCNGYKILKLNLFGYLILYFTESFVNYLEGTFGIEYTDEFPVE